MIPSVIAWLAARWGLSTVAVRLGALGVGLLLLIAAWGLHQWRVSDALEAARESGRVEERVKWQAATDAERLRQADAASRAAADGAAIAARIARERDDLAAQLEDIAHAADTDPDRNAMCLDADSVRRLDAIGRGR